MSQALHAIIHSRVEIGIANYAIAHLGADILLLEPGEEDADMFFTKLLSTGKVICPTSELRLAIR